MKFLEEVEEKTDVVADSWSYFPNADEFSASIWFDHYVKYDEDETLPITWEELDTLNDKYDVACVTSHSDGKTGSRVEVRIKNP